MANENVTPSVPSATPPPPAKTGRSPVIRMDTFGGEEDPDRVLKRQVPAWLLSLGIHVVLFSVFLVLNFIFGGRSIGAAAHENQEINTKMDEEKEEFNLENPDIGLDPNLPTNYNVDRIEDHSVPGKVLPDEPIGNMGEGNPQTVPPPPGVGDGQGGGVDSPTAGLGALGQTGGMMGPPSLGIGFQGRSGATREKMATAGGGNKASEAAVARGLIWLAKVQKGNGSWESDGSAKAPVASTGIALLPFLAAGYTHKGGAQFNKKEMNKYVKNVANGIDYLLKLQRPTGDFGTQNMYEHAIATMALCEAFGMTQDPKLRYPCQKAIEFIVKAQHPAGGWRYGPGQAGDTSVTGWQVQALKSGHLAGLSVPKDTLQKAMSFLDSVSGGTSRTGSTYGYTDKNGSPSMTAVGLLCRQYLGWGQHNPSIVAGISELKKIPPKGSDPKIPNPVLDIYYYYYASQVVHNYDGPDWHVFWNPSMRDWLVKLQVPQGNGQNEGSWDPDQSITGSAGGRLFTSCMALLTLEIYYRYLPLYKKDGGGLKDLEGN
jgi:hypothetical protein